VASVSRITPIPRRVPMVPARPMYATSQRSPQLNVPTQRQASG
jgi:hypothetical protein